MLVLRSGAETQLGVEGCSPPDTKKYLLWDSEAPYPDTSEQAFPLVREERSRDSLCPPSRVSEQPVPKFCGSLGRSPWSASAPSPWSRQRGGAGSARGEEEDAGGAAYGKKDGAQSIAGDRRTPASAYVLLPLSISRFLLMGIIGAFVCTADGTAAGFPALRSPARSRRHSLQRDASPRWLQCDTGSQIPSRPRPGLAGGCESPSEILRKHLLGSNFSSFKAPPGCLQHFLLFSGSCRKLFNNHGKFKVLGFKTSGHGGPDVLG